MNDDKRHGEKDFDRIEPVVVRLTQTVAETASVKNNGERFIPALIIGGLLSLFAIVFLISRLWPDTGNVPPPDPGETLPVPGQTTTSAPLVTTQTNASLSPLQDETQAVAFRKESQEVLSALLAVNEALKTKAVDQWAAQEYANALEHTEQGDQYYRRQEFQSAIMEYKQGLAIMQHLNTEADKVARQAIEQGYAHLQSGNAGAAAISFKRARLIAPENADVVSGLRCAAALDETTALVARGDALLQQGKAGQARDKFKQAASLEQCTDTVQKRLVEVERGIRDSNFNNAMSAGYRALEKNDYKQAAERFAEALKIKPGAEEASLALSHSKQGLITDRLTTLLNRGRTLETEERWDEAVQVYAEALQLDKNSAAAQQGKDRAGKRQGLDESLNRTIKNPYRLSSKDVQREAQELLDMAASIDSVLAPRLTEQKKTLENLLQQVKRPVQINLTSDKQTEVTIYKVAKLGSFEKTSLQLLPGQYVAVGIREGYRDVRVEISIHLEGGPQTIDIRCKEKIAFNG